MGLHFSESKGRLIVLIEGDLDHHSADGIRMAIEREIRLRGAVKHIVFDFSKVGFMDSSGIGMVMGRYKTAREYGGDVYIRGAKGHVARIIELSGLNKIVKCEGEVV